MASASARPRRAPCWEKRRSRGPAAPGSPAGAPGTARPAAQPGGAGPGVRSRLRAERRAQGEGRVRAVDLQGFGRPQRRARDRREPRGLMADRRGIRAEANVLVQELLTRLDTSDVRELS